MELDILVRGGLVFDGSGAAPAKRDVGIAGGSVVAIAESLEGTNARETIDARGAWVTPGFLDVHTHYDAELLAAPALSESIRHGVTTVTIGSCSISTILADAEDCSDMFTRVESIPRSEVLPLLRQHKTWSSPRGYVDHLERHPLGANVTAFLGHSDLRARVLGLGRSLDPEVRPTEEELRQMERWIEEALDVGMLGLSTMTNPWDKVDGDRFRSKALPSTYATWSEYRRLNRILRRRGRILQSAPNITTKVNALAFLLESMGLFGKETLKTTLITLADAKTSPGLHRVLGALTRFVNRFLRADLRWQTLPVPFEVYADGIDLVVFEEFGAGEAALHLVDEVERNALLSDEAYRRRFRKDYEKKWSPRVWQRDFHDALVVGAPDATLIGRSFGAIAEERGLHPVDLFLDLVVEHGTRLRWRTTIANHRPAEVARMIAEPAALVGFADSGAHIRNMAFYSFPLRMLRFVRDADRRGQPVMSIARAVHRLTGELADWLDVDAGHLAIGRRADLVVVDPEGLDDRLDAYHEAPMEGFGGLSRMVNRSDGAVRSVVVNGRIAYRDGAFAGDLGSSRGFGRFLPAGQRVPGVAHPVDAAVASERRVA